MKLIGYAREGRSSETLEQQVHCLMDYGLNIENIFKERRSSIDGNRPALSECIKSLEADESSDSKLPSFKFRISADLVG